MHFLDLVLIAFVCGLQSTSVDSFSARGLFRHSATSNRRYPRPLDPASSLIRHRHRQAHRDLDHEAAGSDVVPAGSSSNSSSNDRSEKDIGTTTTYYSPNVPLGERRTDRHRAQTDTTEDDASTSSAASSSSTNEYSFFDEAVIQVRAGSGGQGASTYKKAVGGQNGPPDGGNGGQGGHVLLTVDPSLNTLAGLTNAWRPNAFGGSGAATSSSSSTTGTATTNSAWIKTFRAENGGNGERQFKNGRYGKDVVIRVPPGTVVQEQVTTYDDDGTETIAFLDLGSLTVGSDDDNGHMQQHEQLVVARGGQGGEGTGIQGKKNRGVRRPRIPPEGGERKTLKLTLKIVADVALVGVPNAGKSTFLAAVTRAKPKIANYPFTTVIPNLGVWIPNSDSSGYSKRSSQSQQIKGAGSDGLVLCDVPGLIAGAAQGVGLGHAFLRHVERCHVILHLVDATSDNPIADFEMLNQEIVKYGTGQLANMPQVVVVNKVDAFDNPTSGGGGGVRRENDFESGLQVKWPREKLEKELKRIMPHSRLMWMSAREAQGVDELMTRLAAFVRKVKSL